MRLLRTCFMPDHAHLVLLGLSEFSDLRRLAARWKQATGYWYKARYGRSLWMNGYQDRLLRDGESTLDVVHYVLRNPVRAGLARQIGEFPFAGSDIFSNRELEDVLLPG